jgi:hypothetical protein
MRAQLSGGAGATIRIDPRRSHAQTCFVACPLVCRGNAVARVRGKASSPSQDHDGRTRRPKCGYLAPHSRFLLGQITPRLSDDHITRSYWPRDFFCRCAGRIPNTMDENRQLRLNCPWSTSLLGASDGSEVDKSPSRTATSRLGLLAPRERLTPREHLTPRDISSEANSNRCGDSDAEILRTHQHNS